MTSPKYNFSLVPNNSEGWAFIDQMRRFLNPNQRLRVRGQKLNALGKSEGGYNRYRYSVPLSRAEYLRIYIEVKK